MQGGRNGYNVSCAALTSFADSESLSIEASPTPTSGSRNSISGSNCSANRSELRNGVLAKTTFKIVLVSMRKSMPLICVKGGGVYSTSGVFNIIFSEMQSQGKKEKMRNKKKNEENINSASDSCNQDTKCTDMNRYCNLI